jgi:hypothetical protein
VLWQINGVFMSDDTEVTGTLENWRVQDWDNLEYVIWGNVNGDVNGRFRDGYYIHTSGITKSLHPVSSLKEGVVVHTRNSAYLLGGELES